MACLPYLEYTDEQLNYFRICYIFSDILAEGLRTIFKQEWDDRYKAPLGEWKDEPRNGRDFWNLESPKKRETHARHLDRNEWDCAVLFYALLYSDCIFELNPIVKQGVDDLRQSRNKYFLGVPRGSLSNHEFQSAISTVLYAFQSLMLPIDQIEGVLNHTVEYTKEQLNYFRICFVTTDLVSEGLRTVFKREWDGLHRATLGEWEDGHGYGVHFYNKEKGRSMSLLFKNKVNRDQWDCSMLIKAILNSRSIHDPSSVAKICVDDLRKFRNENVKHAPRGRLSDLEFQISIDKVLVAFDRLNLPSRNILDIKYLQDKILLKKRDPARSDVPSTYNELESEQNLRTIPPYILARGKEAKEAYQRALKTGETSDKRVKVMMVGQDRVGKTSVGRSLKGERFRQDEPSTNGVQIDAAVKHAGAMPWANSTEEQEMTPFHYKCARYISDHLSTVSLEEKVLGKEEMAEKIASETESPLDDRGEEMNSDSGDKLHGPHDHFKRRTAKKDVSTSPMSQDNAEPEKYGNLDVVYSKEIQETKRKDDIPDKVTKLAIENLAKKKSDNDDGVWPVILDFAGQAIYRAIHPLFTSREAIYVLMFDLTKDLSALAQCFVKEPHYGEAEISAPDSNDTNLDHMMRWMDLVNSFKHVENGEILPPVILVGTHADLLERDLSVRKKCVEDVKEKIWDTTRDFSEHICKTFAVNNTLAGKELGEEDPQIVRLREEILKVGEGMPHTKLVVPIRWLQVEDEVYDLASKGTNYITRQDFKENICDDICQFEIEDDFEVLLNFLHDRGTVVYHGCANQPDSLVVLNPKWLVDVLCQIITVEKQSEETTIIRNLRKDLGKYGILHPDLLHESCERLKLANIKESLLAIMKMFNLLCEHTRKDGCSIYLVPCMLTSKAEDEMRLNAFGN